MTRRYHTALARWVLPVLWLLSGCTQEVELEPRTVVANSYALSGLVQSAASGTTLSSTISASFANTPTAGNLLIAIASSPSSASSVSGPSGWTLAVNSANQSPGQVVYYKVAGTSESKSVSVGFPFLNLTHALRLLEFSGFDGRNAPVTSTKTGSLTSLAFTSVTTTAPSALVIAASYNNGVLFTPNVSSWSNSFTDLNTYNILLTVDSIASAYRVANAAGSYTTTASLSVSAGVIGHMLAFNRLPPAVASFGVTAGAAQNRILFSAPDAPVSQVMILAKTTDCSFSATPTGSESRGATVGNATLIFNDSPIANLATTTVAMSGVNTTVTFDATSRTLTHASLTAGTLYCYRIISRNGLALDTESASPKTRSATPYSVSTSAPQFILSSGSTTLSAASIIPGTGAYYADNAGQLITVGPSGLPSFALYQLPDGVQSRIPVGTLGSETDSTAFISALDGDVYAVWATGTLSGTLRWSSESIDGNSTLAGDQALGATLYAPPLVSNSLSRVFVSTRNATTDTNRIFALNAATGACVWVLNGSCSGTTSTLSIGQISAVPLLDATNYRLLFTSALYGSGSTLWAVDAHDSASGNRVLWSRNLGNIDSALSFTSASRDAILVGTNSGRIYKLDPSDGTTCWGQTSDGCAHVATGTEQFFCTDPAVNARATSCASGVAIQKSLVPVNGTFLGNVVFSTTDGYVRMINSQGVQVWRTLVSGASPPLPLPTVGSGKVYVGGSDGLVHELSLSDGAQTATRSVGGGSVVAGAPAYDSTGGTLHVNTSQGSQYGFTVPF